MTTTGAGKRRPRLQTSHTPTPDVRVTKRMDASQGGCMCCPSSTQRWPLYVIKLGKPNSNCTISVCVCEHHLDQLDAATTAARSHPCT